MLHACAGGSVSLSCISTTQCTVFHHSSRQLVEIICCEMHPFDGTCIGVSFCFVLYATIPGVQSEYYTDCCLTLAFFIHSI